MPYQGLDVGDFYRQSSQATAKANQENPLFKIGRKAGDAFGTGLDNVQSGLAGVMSNTGVTSILGGVADQYQSELDMAQSALGAIGENIGLDKQIEYMKSRGGGGGAQGPSTGDQVKGALVSVAGAAASAGITALI